MKLIALATLATLSTLAVLVSSSVLPHTALIRAGANAEVARSPSGPEARRVVPFGFDGPVKREASPTDMLSHPRIRVPDMADAAVEKRVVKPPKVAKAPGRPSSPPPTIYKLIGCFFFGNSNNETRLFNLTYTSISNPADQCAAKQDELAGNAAAYQSFNIITDLDRSFYANCYTSTIPDPAYAEECSANNLAFYEVKERGKPKQ